MTPSVNLFSSLLASSVAGWRGSVAFRPARRQPEKPLELYEFEACPYCRLVREALTELDLDVLIRPCPQGGQRYRAQVQSLGGKLQFPFLVDPNTGARLYESAAIIEYLARTYDGRTRKTRGWRRSLALGGSYGASALRVSLKGVRGLKAQASKAPAKPLELYSFESSPYSRPVRELLCELELPYLLRNTGKGRMSDMGPASWRDQWFKGPKDTTRNRAVLAGRANHVQVPYLVDPNTGVEMFESKDIMAYLLKTYGA